MGFWRTVLSSTHATPPCDFTVIVLLLLLARRGFRR
jgi:hypothetical protein